MKLLFFIILSITTITNYCFGQVEYIYSDIHCEEEQQITRELYSADFNDKDLWINTLIKAEKAVEKETDLFKVTGSLVRIYQLYDIIDNTSGKNRCLQKMMHLAETSGDNEIFIRAKILQVHGLLRDKQTKEAVECYKEAIQYLEPRKANREIARLYCFLAYTHEYMHNDVMCIKNILKAVTMVENDSIDDPLLMGEVYLHTAIIYLHQEDYVKANGYITGALTLFRTNKDSEQRMYRNFLNTALIVDADIKRLNGELSTAIKVYKEGIESFEEFGLDNSARNSLKYISDGHNGLGITYQLSGDDKSAIYNMMIALQIRKNLAMQDKIADSYITIAEYYTHKKMLDSAYYYNVNGFNIAQDIKDYKQMSRAANNLSKYFAKKKNFEKAYKYRIIADDAIDAISSMKTTKEIAREEMDYMFDQERMLVEKDKENKQKIIDQDQNMFKWMKIFCVLAALMTIVIILLFYKKKKKNEQLRKQRDTLQLRSRQLQIQQEEIAQKNQELRATTEMLEERNKELQMLSAVAAMTSNSIFITDKDGKFLWMNEAFSRETHIPLDQLHTHPALKKSSMTPETKRVYETIIATKKPQIYTAEMRHLNRAPFWVQSAVTPVFDDNGEISMIVWVSTDVTELHRAYEKIDDQNKEINASIAYARRIQDAVQPMKIFSDEILGDHFVINMPRNIVSGDFHWVGYKNGLSIFTVSDCTGHGVPGAFISMLGQVMLSQTLDKLNDITAANILNIMRNGIIHQLHQRDKDGASSDSMDASMFVYDRSNGVIDFAGAYSHAYLLRFGTPDEETKAVCAESECKIITNEANDAYLIRLKANRMTIGIDRRDTIPFKGTKIKVNHGDIAYATTDGYPDQFGGDKQKRLNIATFEKILLQYCHLSMEDQRKELERTFLEWKGNYEQTDDVHVLGIVL